MEGPTMVIVGKFGTDGGVVFGTANPVVARQQLIEHLIEQDDLDTFGVCLEGGPGGRGYCDLQHNDLCEGCEGFINAIFDPGEAKTYPAIYWESI